MSMVCQSHASGLESAWSDRSTSYRYPLSTPLFEQFPLFFYQSIHTPDPFPMQALLRARLWQRRSKKGRYKLAEKISSCYELSLWDFVGIHSLRDQCIRSIFVWVSQGDVIGILAEHTWLRFGLHKDEQEERQVRNIQLDVNIYYDLLNTCFELSIQKHLSRKCATLGKLTAHALRCSPQSAATIGRTLFSPSTESFWNTAWAAAAMEG